MERNTSFVGLYLTQYRLLRQALTTLCCTMPTQRPVFSSKREPSSSAPIPEQVQNKDVVAEQAGDNNDAEETEAPPERPATPLDREQNTTPIPDIEDTKEVRQEPKADADDVPAESAGEGAKDDEDEDDELPSSVFNTDDHHVPKWINALLEDHIDKEKFNLLFKYMKSEGNAIHKIVDELHINEDLRRVACVSQCNLYMLVKELHDSFKPGAEHFTKHVLTDSKEHVQTYHTVASKEDASAHHLRKAAKNISRHGTWQVLQYCMQTAEYEENVDHLTAALLQIRETFLSRHLPPLEDLIKRIGDVHEFQDEITQDVSKVITENHSHSAHWKFGTKSKADPSISPEYHARYLPHIAKSLNQRIHDLVALKEDVYQSIQELHNIDRRIDNLQVVLLNLRIRVRSFFSIFHSLHLALAFFDEDLEHHDKDEGASSRSKHHLESLQVVLNAFDDFVPGTECHLDKSWTEPLNGDSKFAVPFGVYMK
ncbi:hypothetical protein BJ165DRAFT_647697 [Panaeolus papilionaceus]|nr:hypothetical protein BJ165DRAFT_647697 [Panaeolus papilionaceus]